MTSRGGVPHFELWPGPFANPDELAYGRGCLPALPLYWNRFRQADVWPDCAGLPNDCVEVEICEHWLELA